MAAIKDDRGRFIKGNQAAKGKGRPPREKELAYLEATMDSCTLADWREIVRKNVELAKTGDVNSRNWLSKYLLSEPEQNVNVNAEGAKTINFVWSKLDDNAGHDSN